MFDIGLSQMAIAGAVALVVLGPEKLPRVARTLGHLLGKAQRYVAEVKAEVNRSIELEELRKMKESVEGAAREVEQSVQQTSAEFEREWAEVTGAAQQALSGDLRPPPQYRHPRKKWRLKQGAVPQWYKARNGIRTRALSGAARVARYRPARPPQ